VQHVYSTSEGLKRYRFPTHINDLVYDRANARRSEAFVVVLEPGGAPPMHKHDDTEQVFHVIEGHGVLTIGPESDRRPVAAGDVVVIPPSTWHSIRAQDGTMRYLAIDCFGSESERKEATWDEHARVLCEENGWDYSTVVETE